MENINSCIKDDMEESFTKLFEAVDKEKWPLFIQVQKQLLQGKPIDIETVAEILGASVEDTAQIVGQFGETDQQEKVVAFAGVSIIPTPHSFKVHGKQLYTWCAADALIFPGFLDVTAEIASKDPINGEPITLTVEGKKIKAIEPENALVSWVTDQDINDIRATMCNRIHFFVSENTANEWQHQNPDAQVFQVKEFLKFSLNPMDCC
ncbi:MAG: hypothetical protein JKY52_03770 [Flavobacteriales bacterium]|nr:hypothetical protein [Flavobacteriales bacterium]